MADLNSPHNEHGEEASMSMKVLLLIFAVVVVGALGYLVWNQSNSPDTTDNSASVIVKKPTATSTATISPTATTTDATADWKTYTNTSNYFTIKYPASLTVNSSDPANIFFSTTNSADNSVLSVYISSTTKTLDALIADKSSSTSIGKEQQKTILDGKTAYAAIDYGVVNQYSIYSVNNATFYELHFAGTNKETLAASKAALSTTQQNMLATFKFTK